MCVVPVPPYLPYLFVLFSHVYFSTSPRGQPTLSTLWSLNVLNLASPAHNTGHGLQTRDSALRSENTDTPPASQAPQWHSVTRVSGLARSHRSQFCASMAFFRLATVAITGPAAARSLREISSR